MSERWGVDTARGIAREGRCGTRMRNVTLVRSGNGSAGCRCGLRMWGGRLSQEPHLSPRLRLIIVSHPELKSVLAKLLFSLLAPRCDVERVAGGSIRMERSAGSIMRMNVGGVETGLHRAIREGSGGIPLLSIRRVEWRSLGESNLLRILRVALLGVLHVPC